MSGECSGWGGQSQCGTLRWGLSRGWAVRLLPALSPLSSTRPIPSALLHCSGVRPAAAPHSSFAAGTNGEFILKMLPGSRSGQFLFSLTRMSFLFIIMDFFFFKCNFRTGIDLTERKSRPKLTPLDNRYCRVGLAGMLKQTELYCACIDGVYTFQIAIITYKCLNIKRMGRN